jgi:hypothetical protein
MQNESDPMRKACLILKFYQSMHGQNVHWSNKNKNIFPTVFAVCIFLYMYIHCAPSSACTRWNFQKKSDFLTLASRWILWIKNVHSMLSKRYSCKISLLYPLAAVLALATKNLYVMRKYALFMFFLHSH